MFFCIYATSSPLSTILAYCHMPDGTMQRTWHLIATEPIVAEQGRGVFPTFKYPTKTAFANAAVEKAATLGDFYQAIQITL